MPEETKPGATELATTLQTRELPSGPPRRRAIRIVHSPDRATIGRTVPLDGTVSVFGRGGSNGGLVDDPRLSRTHASVKRVSGGIDTIEDLQSRNGTFVDGARIQGAQTIDAGSVIAIGDTLLVVDEEPSPDSLPSSERADPTPLDREVVGISFATAQLKRSIATVAPANGAVLLLGPTGSGKEVTARAIHKLSGRSGAWVPVNCAAIPAELAESELFGHKKGAFTGAANDREGYFADADGGTLFLDEVGDLPPPVQAKLLRVLEEGLVQPLGGGKPRPVSVRVVAATNVDLDASGFRGDLFARLGDWVLRVPPLASRRADVLALWDHFTNGHPRTPELSHALLLYPWKFNVRELAKLAGRMMTLSDGKPFDLPSLPESFRDALRSPRGAAPVVAEAVDDKDSAFPDRAAVLAAVQEAKGNIAQVGRLLGCQRTQVYRYLQRFGIDPDQFR